MLYIMRHSKTEWNSRRKLQGRTDIPLSEEGRAMAKNAAEEYQNINFDVCFCSPLIRAKETAEMILKGREVPIIADDRLIEMSFGIYEGVENSFQIPDCPINVLFKSPAEYINPPEGAESLESLYSRTAEFLKEAVAPRLKAGENILIVGHRAMNSSIICQVKNIPIEKFWSIGIDNCKILKLI